MQEQQMKDPELAKLMVYLKTKTLPEDPQEAKLIGNLARKGYFVVDDVLYYEGTDIPNRQRMVVPKHLKEEVMNEHHDTMYAGHFQ